MSLEPGPQYMLGYQQEQKQGCCCEATVLYKVKVMFTLNYPFSSLPGEFLRSPVTMEIGSAVSTLIYSKRVKEEKEILLQMGTVYFNFRCQNKMSLVLDSQPYDAGNTYWISSAVS